MIDSFYEHHHHLEPDFPIIFHPNLLSKKTFFNDRMHWHESLEMIYITEGECYVICGPHKIDATTGDLILINPNDLHRFEAISPHTHYYCLIIHPSLYEYLGLDLLNFSFENNITAPKCIEIFTQIIHEMTHQSTSYKIAVKGLIAYLLVEIIRHHTLPDSNLVVLPQNTKKMNMIKKAIQYIQKHYRKPLTIDEICVNIGFSKYYLCRTFKEITGQTVTDYINSLRCQYAQKLLRSNQYNVSESCELAGFSNLPYFSRIYKKYIGYPPSAEKHHDTSIQ